MTTNPTTASMLFAMSQGSTCCGKFRCYWCGAPCDDSWQHLEPRPVIGVKWKPQAKSPSSPYVCIGCWLWRRQRVTVRFLAGGFKDGQAMAKHSWWITDREAWAVRKEDFKELYKLLLKPPTRFTLCLLSGGDVVNLLQCSLLNDIAEIRAETQLGFTINNVPHSYSVYELEEALRHGLSGKEPGVRALVQHLGPLGKGEKEEKGKAGRPPALKDARTALKEPISMSGSSGVS